MPTETPPSNRVANASGEVVTQSEIESLLALVGGENGAEVPAAAAPAKGGDAVINTHRHEFPLASSLSVTELRKLRVRHEDFLQSLSSRLSLHFRMECNMQMLRLDTMPYRQFIDGLNNPTHLTLFKVEPLRGICFFELPIRLALCIIDRELGGSARAPDEARELTRMDARIAARVIDMIISEWSGTWNDIMDLRGSLLRTENNGRFLQGNSPNAPMLVLGIEARIGMLVENMQVAFPCQTLEPLLLKLAHDPDLEEARAAAQSFGGMKWKPELMDLMLHLKALLPDVEISARELGHLKVGDVVPIHSHQAEEAVLQIEEHEKFIGNFGLVGQQMALQLTGLCKR